jgi:Zn(2)-Cys(6) binuclear cluster domain-containing protein
MVLQSIHDPAMPQTPMMEQFESDTGLKPYSCLTCRQRKVKCDRRTPCSNCGKAGKQCSFIPPVRGKRTKTKIPREGLHAKLRRYEELLKSYGANIGPSEDGAESDLDTSSHGDIVMAQDTRSKARDASVVPEIIPRFVNKDGSSRYFDRYNCDVVRSHLDTSLNHRSAPWSHLGVDVTIPLRR